jgi:uncharacterized membrane protein (DUF4010 family)
MPHKQVSVVALTGLHYQGAERVAGEVFAVGVIEAIVLGRKKQVRRVAKALTAQPVAASQPRRGTYRRRDLVAE